MGKKTLLRLYEKSDRLNIDEKSKIVIISDVHRGDGSYADSFIGNKNIYFAALSYYFKNGYTLVEAGDGDELWKNKNFIDIAYNYKGIFVMFKKFLKLGRLHLLYGNHDEKKCCKEFIAREIRRLSSIEKNFGKDFIDVVKNVNFKEALVLNYKPLNKEIFITHGHQIDFMNYEFCLVNRFLVRYVWRFLEGAGFKAPTSPASNYERGGKVDEKLDKWARDNKKMIICGHTHTSRFPKVGEGTYFNDGCCVLPYSISNIEIDSGKISLIKWSIYVNEDATLYIDRNILTEPVHLSEYLQYTR